MAFKCQYRVADLVRETEIVIEVVKVGYQNKVYK